MLPIFRTLFPALVLLAAAAVAGCANRDVEAGQGALVGPEWQLVSVQQSSRTYIPADPLTVPSVQFTTDVEAEDARMRVAGFTGCNRFFGTYVAGEDGSLELGPLGVTRMACPPKVMEVETAMLQALERAERYELRANELLVHGMGGTARFATMVID